METLQIPDEVKEILHYAEGKTLEEKLARLVVSDLGNRLRSCAERLCEFEEKYGIAFEQFKKEWGADNVPERYSYEVERDYMEWESLDDEHDLLLFQIREIKARRKQ